ncbi:MAG: hypothetical protein IPG96_02450 [Proteobacteria bacterium]|nr:hypothetical protein [Pseudomonadota bacterium]
MPTLGLAATAGLRYPRALALEFRPVLEGAAVLSWEAFDSGLRQARVREVRRRRCASAPRPRPRRASSSAS